MKIATVENATLWLFGEEVIEVGGVLLFQEDSAFQEYRKKFYALFL